MSASPQGAVEPEGAWLEPGTLPRGWATATVGEVAALTDGPFGSNLKTSHYVDAGPRVVRLQNIGDGVFRDEQAHITEFHFETLRKHEVVPGDVVVASLDDAPPRACLVPDWLGPAIVKADCIRVRTQPTMDPGFVMWMLNSPPAKAQAATLVKGVGRPRLGLGGIRRLAIPVPPLNEQRRIVAAIEEHLSRLDAADALLGIALRRLDRMPRIVLASALSNITDYVRLADIADVRLGRQRSPKNHVGTRMRPYLRAANITWDGLNLSDVKEMNFTEIESETYELVNGDVLLSEASGSASEVGKPAVWRGEIEGCCFQNTLIRVRSRGPDPNYLRMVFLSDALAGKFAQAAPGVGIHHLGSTRLSNWQVPLPSHEEQRRIVARVKEQLSAIDALQAAIERAQRRSQSLRRAVLERAFRGKLVPQDPADEPAEALLARIRAERESIVRPGRLHP